jgi:hypothetical protein
MPSGRKRRRDKTVNGWGSASWCICIQGFTLLFARTSRHGEGKARNLLVEARRRHLRNGALSIYRQSRGYELWFVTLRIISIG